MKIKQKLIATLNRHKLTRRLTDYDFRTILFTVITFTITAGYAVFFIVLGITLHSLWYGILAGYYLMIASMRSFVVFYHNGRRKRAKRDAFRNEELSRARIYRNCGIILSLLVIPLSLEVLQMVANRATFSYAGYTIFAVAAYTTYKAIMSVYNFVKSKRSDFLTVRCARNINLADMLVSLLVLQTAMFNSFSPDLDCSVFNACTGAAVCALTLVIGVYMIVGGRRAVRQAKLQIQSRETSATEKEEV